MPVCVSSNTAADPYEFGAWAGGVPTVDGAEEVRTRTTTLNPALSVPASQRTKIRAGR